MSVIGKEQVKIAVGVIRERLHCPSMDPAEYLYTIRRTIVLQSKVGLGRIMKMREFSILVSDLLFCEPNLYPPEFAFSQMKSQRTDLVRTRNYSNRQLWGRHILEQFHRLSPYFFQTGKTKPDLPRNSG